MMQESSSSNWREVLESRIDPEKVEKPNPTKEFEMNNPEGPLD